ncbi:helix-turn-helix domain-containing protein [Streptomyces sp. LZ34]
MIPRLTDYDPLLAVGLPRDQRPAIHAQSQARLPVQQGYEGVSIEDIARAAGVSRPVVYQHHGSQEGIFVACVREPGRNSRAPLSRRSRQPAETWTS